MLDKNKSPILSFPISETRKKNLFINVLFWTLTKKIIHHLIIRDTISTNKHIIMVTMKKIRIQSPFLVY